MLRSVTAFDAYGVYAAQGAPLSGMVSRLHPKEWVSVSPRQEGVFTLPRGSVATLVASRERFR